jgi:CobQ-like glutamine amidotransferase family enzyme
MLIYLGGAHSTNQAIIIEDRNRHTDESIRLYVNRDASRIPPKSGLRFILAFFISY